MNPTRNTIALAAGTAALLALITACAPSEENRRLSQVFVVSTATANEYRPAVSEDVQEVLIRSARIRDSRAVVLLPVDGTVREQGGAELTVLRGNDTEADPARRRVGFEEKVMALDSVLASTRSPSTTLDLLTGLNDAAARADNATIVVISSGLQTTGLMDFTRLGWETDPEAAVDTVEQEGFLPDLAGKDVYFSGLGDTTGDQAPLPAPMRLSVEALWLTLCERAEANSCTLLAGADRVEAAAHTDGMVTVPVPVFELSPLVDGRGETVWSLDSEALFAPDSAVLLPAARTALTDASASVVARGATVSVIGRTWRVGPPEGAQALSRDRARAVADYLVGAGVPASSITSVRGVGYDDPLPATAGRDAAASNRSVTITVTTS